MVTHVRSLSVTTDGKLEILIVSIPGTNQDLVLQELKYSFYFMAMELYNNTFQITIVSNVL
jgi:hypothetical protein